MGCRERGNGKWFNSSAEVSCRTSLTWMHEWKNLISNKERGEAADQSSFNWECLVPKTNISYLTETPARCGAYTLEVVKLHSMKQNLHLKKYVVSVGSASSKTMELSSMCNKWCVEVIHERQNSEVNWIHQQKVTHSDILELLMTFESVCFFIYFVLGFCFVFWWKSAIVTLNRCLFAFFFFFFFFTALTVPDKS